MSKILFPLGLSSRPRWENLYCSPRPLAVFNGPTSKGREEEEGGKGKWEKRVSFPPNILAWNRPTIPTVITKLNAISVLNDDFLVFADCTSTRGHCYKLYKGYSQVNTHKYFFANSICDIWNALPSSVVEASSLTVFKGLLDNVDLTRYFIDRR